MYHTLIEPLNPCSCCIQLSWLYRFVMVWWQISNSTLPLKRFLAPRVSSLFDGLGWGGARVSLMVGVGSCQPQEDLTNTSQNLLQIPMDGWWWLNDRMFDIGCPPSAVGKQGFSPWSLNCASCMEALSCTCVWYHTCVWVCNPPWKVMFCEILVILKPHC